jgi:N-acetylglucosamine-6-phosphate deacetylase
VQEDKRLVIIADGFVFCDDGVFRKLNVDIENGVITAIKESCRSIDRNTVDAKDCYVVPGLVDIHTHGAMGADFCDGTQEATQEIARYLLGCGVTSFLGTTMTLPEHQLLKICKTARPFVKADYPNQAVLRGIHLEGPFIGHEKRGAQNAAYIIRPDYSMLMRLHEASGMAVCLVVVAPEVDGGMEFIQGAASICVVSLAHSSADYETSYNAFTKGANHVTHLFNGMNPYSHREPGIIGAAFDSGAYVELIADGIHIHPSVIRATFKLFGDDRVCLISDSMRACGLADGEYDLGGQIVTVVGRSATIDNGSLAGSVTNLADCMRRTIEYGVPFSAALKAATINPAKSIGIDKEVGSLTIGKRADILILEQDLQLKQIIHGGKCI